MTIYIVKTKSGLSQHHDALLLFLSLSSRLSASFLFILCILSMGLSHSVFAEAVIEKPNTDKTISIWGEYHPPLNGNKDDENPGFMVEIAQSIFAKNGYSINYILGSRFRGVNLVKEGEIDCIMNAKIKDHHFLSFPEEPWGYHAATLFALPNSSFQYEEMNQVKEVQLGAIAGMRYDNGKMDEYLNKPTDNISLLYGEDAMEREIKMLLNKRIEVLVSCPLLIRGQLESMQLPTDTIKIVGEIKPFVGMYLACGRRRAKTEEYIKMINQAIPLMRESGELDTILKKYGQIDWLEIYQSLDTPH